MTPMVMGVIPFALAIGTAIGASSLSDATGLLGAVVILAGSAQLATIQMLDSGTSSIVIISSAILINARIVLYSAALAPWFADQPLRRRLVLAIPVIDQMHFTCGARFERGDLDTGDRTAYYTGAAIWLVAAWLGTQTIAVFVGGRAPEALGLDVAGPLALVGLLAKSTATRPAVVAALTGLAVAVFAIGLPLHSSVLAASIAGIAVGRIAARPGRHTDTSGVGSECAPDRHQQDAGEVGR